MGVEAGVAPHPGPVGMAVDRYRGTPIVTQRRGCHSQLGMAGTMILADGPGSGKWLPCISAARSVPEAGQYPRA